MVAGTGGVNGAGALLVTLPLAVQGAWPSRPVVRRHRAVRKSGTGLYATTNGTIESGA